MNNNINIIPGYMFIPLLLAVAVCASTLTTKQHVLLDVVGGIVLAEGSYYVVKKTGFAKQYAQCLKAVSRKLFVGGRKA